MNKTDIKAMLEDAGVTVTDDMVTSIHGKLDKTVPYRRFQEKVKDAETTTANYAELESKYNKSVTDMDALSTLNKGLSDYKTKWEAHETKELDAFKDTYSKRMEVFSITDKDTRYETIQKLKDDFVFAEEGKTLSLDQMQSNIKQLGLLEKTGVLSVPEVNNNSQGTPPSQAPTTQAFDPVSAAFANQE